MEPYSHKARTVEREKVWRKIADNLNSPAVLRFLVTKKSVSEHLKLLLDKYHVRMQKDRKIVEWKWRKQSWTKPWRKSTRSGKQPKNKIYYSEDTQTINN